MATYLEILCSGDGGVPVIYGHRQLAPRQTVGHVFDTLPVPSPPRATNFGSSSSIPKMDLSRSTLRVMAGGIYRMLFPSGFRPSFPSRPPSLSLGAYSLFSRIHSQALPMLPLTPN